MDTNNTGNVRTKKAIIRAKKLSERKNLTPKEVMDRSKLICDRFLQCPEYLQASTILLYKAYNNEVDTDLIFSQAKKDGKTVAYPLSTLENGEPDLCFYVIDDLNELKSGFKGIKEPDTGKDPKGFTGKADICITPGVAFDKSCHRIGYGKAFYDRFIRQNEPGTVIGLAYDLQMTDEFETEESDRKVDIVITESAVYRR